MVAARIAGAVEIGLRQRVAGVEHLVRTRSQRHTTDVLTRQRINNRHTGQRHVAGVGHRHRVVQNIADRVGQCVAVAARDVDKRLVDRQRRVARQYRVRREGAVLIADTFHVPIIDKVEDARVIGRAADVGRRLNRLASIVAPVRR